MLLVSERTLEACRLNEREAVVCAFSGGPDSTALLLELVRLRGEGRIGPLCAGHFEHGIRGRESREDLEHCRALCLSLQVPLFSESADVPAFAEREGLSVETAARELRYDFLRRLKCALGAGCIALGHHLDDQAETVLLHLIRGSGMAGLVGMAPRSGDLVRPLLGTGKGDILGYLAERGMSWRLDSTNAMADADRNRLRQQVMGPLEALNPRAAEHIAQCAERLRAENDYLDQLAQKALQEARGSRKALGELSPVLQSRAALLLLRQVTEDFTEADVARLKDLFTLPSGRTAPIRGHLLARADGDRLLIGPAEGPADFSAELTIGEPVDTPWGVYRTEWAEKASLPCPAHEGYLDADKLMGRLLLRQAREKDRFTPLGMGLGSKLLSDLYTDRKMSRRARQTPILTDEEGPVFIPGGTIADRVKITGMTKRIVHITFEKGEADHAELGY